MELVAVNHWDRAIATHAANHPEATHYCVDVYKTPPIEAVPGGRLDLLMASPTCTFYSRARGGKPISAQQKYGRMTPTQVLRWCGELDVRTLLVENVPEFRDWTAVHVLPPASGSACEEAECAPGKACRRRRGMYFRAWIRRLERLDYRVEYRVLNAADYGDATTRSRFFLIGRKDRKPIVWPRPSHSKDGSPSLFGGPTKKWKPARDIIDWSLRGTSIFQRKKPLAKNTLERIMAGLVKFGWPEPFIVVLRRHMDGQRLDDPIPTLCAGGNHVYLAQPVVVRTAMHRSNSSCFRGADEPVATITTDGGFALVLPQGNESPAKPLDEPVPALTTVARVGLVEAFVLAQGSNGAPRSSEEPTPTQCTAGKTAVVRPFLFGNRSNNVPKSDGEPTPTSTTSGNVALAQGSFVLSQGAGGAPRETESPVPTIPGKGAVAFVSPYNGGGSQPRSTEEPLGTQTTRDRFGLVIPITHQDGSARARSVESPVPTVTAAHRGELGVVVAAFGERPGQAPRVHSIDRPVPTIPATGRIPLAHGISGEPEGIRVMWGDIEVVVDILFRMLTPRELARAMSFDDGEIIYEFAGNKTEVTCQIGNAVPVETARALVGAIVEGWS